MPRKKSEFKPLTYKKIISINPERKGITGIKDKFGKLLDKALKTEPFDKKKK